MVKETGTQTHKIIGVDERIYIGMPIAKVTDAVYGHGHKYGAPNVVVSVVPDQCTIKKDRNKR